MRPLHFKILKSAFMKAEIEFLYRRVSDGKEITVKEQGDAVVHSYPNATSEVVVDEGRMVLRINSNATVLEDDKRIKYQFLFLYTEEEALYDDECPFDGETEGITTITLFK